MSGKVGGSAHGEWVGEVLCVEELDCVVEGLAVLVGGVEGARGGRGSSGCLRQCVGLKVALFHCGGLVVLKWCLTVLA